MNINDIPFIELDLDIDHSKLLAEYMEVEKRYEFKGYESDYFGIKRKYNKTWSGIGLISSDGELYSDMSEEEPEDLKPTELEKICPYMFSLIKSLGAEDDRCRIMRIAPKSSLVWHSHVLEHNQPSWQLTCQIPIIVPEEFEYCVLHKDDFKWWKRFHKPEWLENVTKSHGSPGKAFIFNSYHYHNVYNHSDEHRVSLMIYLDYRKSNVKKLVDRSSKTKNVVKSNIDSHVFNQIKESLFNESGAYLRNLESIKEIDWSWNNGQTKITIIYDSGKIDTRDNSEVPPTQACHDIAHFIGGFNGGMEWDYVQDINHIPEYNAVFIEIFLSKLCDSIKRNHYDLETDMKALFNHMKWFAQEYYRIPEEHPSQKAYKELAKDFLKVFDVDKATNAFQIFYEVWCIECYIGSKNFETQVNMTSDLDFYDERVYSYLYNGKKFLESLL